MENDNLLTSGDGDGIIGEINEKAFMQSSNTGKGTTVIDERNVNISEDTLKSTDDICNDVYEGGTEINGDENLDASLTKEGIKIEQKDGIKTKILFEGDGNVEDKLSINFSSLKHDISLDSQNQATEGYESDNACSVNVTNGHSSGPSADNTIEDLTNLTSSECNRITQNESYSSPVEFCHEEAPVFEKKEISPKIELKGYSYTNTTVYIGYSDDTKGNDKWKDFKDEVKNFKRPFMLKHNTLPPNPSRIERVKYLFFCPPHGKVGRFLTYFLLLILFWGSLVYITHDMALPGGTLFSLLVLVVTAQLGGMIVAAVRLPPLLGMLLVGIIFRSVPCADTIGNNISTEWSSSLRSIALVVILLRAGLGLDPEALKKLSFVVLRLAVFPCLVETFTVAVVSHLLLGFPWKWGFLLGFVLSAVSPAVVVPCLLNLANEGYGVEKGIPTLVIAASSMDDVLAISGFGVCLGSIFSKGSALWQGLKGPIEFFMGIGYGIIVGLILWFVPNKKEKNANAFRFLMVLFAGLLAIFGSKGIDFGGAGALGCLCVAFIAGIRWRKLGNKNNEKSVEDYLSFLWTILQPMLFGLIGTEIRVGDLHPATVGWGVVTLVIGLTFRVIVSFFSVLGGNLNLKERFFVALAWLPKATVQAAIGSTALDYARELLDPSSPEILLGTKVLTIAVLVILITAPIGAVAIMLSAPKLLERKVQNSVKQDLKA